MNANSGLGTLSALVALASRGALSKGTGASLHYRLKSAKVLRDHFLLLCSDLSVELLLEVGAHGAETSIDFLQKTGGQAIAFEANPHTFQSKTKLASGRGVDARNIALSDQEGKLDFHIPLFRGREGGEESLTPGNASLRRRTKEVDYETVSIPATTVDLVMEHLNSPQSERSVALWVDVEGMGFEVLTGGTTLLSKESCKVCFVEVEGIAFWKDQSKSDRIDELLNSHGFIPVMRDAEYEFQYNVVYIKESLLGVADERILKFWAALSLVRFNYVSRAYSRSLVYVASTQQRVYSLIRNPNRVERIRKKLSS